MYEKTCRLEVVIPRAKWFMTNRQQLKNILASGVSGYAVCMYLSQQLHQGELHKLLIIVIMLWNYLFFVSEDTTSNLSEQMVVRKSFSKIADH